MTEQTLNQDYRKFFIAIIGGVLSLLLSPLGIEFFINDIPINIPWTLVLPIMVALAYGWKYALVAGLSGGAFFPFLLWVNNGVANVGTSVIFLIFYILLGLAMEGRMFKMIKTYPFRVLASILFTVLCLYLFDGFIFNHLLGLNPPFWESEILLSLPQELLWGFAFKDSVNILMLTFASDTLLRLSFIRRILGLPLYPSMNDNLKIMIITLSTFLFVWLIFVGLGIALLEETNALQHAHLNLAFIVFIISGFFVSRILFYYNELHCETLNNLYTSEEKYRNIFDNVQDVFYQTSTQGIVLEISPSIKYFSDFDKREIIGHPVSDLYYHPDDRDKLINTIVQKGELRDYELKLKSKTGQMKYASINARLIFDQNGNPSHIDGAIRDITERKLLELDLIRTKERAEESDRLKSAFLANMSHEIRTPMNGILGFASLLKEPDLTGEEQQNYIRIIEKSGNRMLNIINDIVDISKIESGTMKVTMEESNINEQIEFVFNFFKPEAEAKGIIMSFSCTLPDKEAYLLTDREKLFAILTNLVKNAVKYTNNGSIELGYTLIPKAPGDSLQMLQFYVKDTGAGIPPNRQEAIFERFIQADIEDTKALQGAGLGLAISRSYVEMLGGRIWVMSKEGSGSTFNFTLPYVTKANNVTLDNNIHSSGTPNHLNNLKILVAEDDITSEMLISIILRKFCRDILIVRSGTEAIEACKQHPDIDLILMDIQMPVMGGLEATKQIRQFNQEVVIIAQTAYGLSGDREKSLAAGCNDYVSKPIDSAILVGLIRKHLEVI